LTLLQKINHLLADSKCLNVRFFESLNFGCAETREGKSRVVQMFLFACKMFVTFLKLATLLCTVVILLIQHSILRFFEAQKTNVCDGIIDDHDSVNPMHKEENKGKTRMAPSL
jgi:hypothetical protein